MAERVKQAGLFHAARPETHRLFFALMPDEPVRDRMRHAAGWLAEQHPDLRARWIRPERFHATLNFLGDYPEPPLGLVSLAGVAADSVQMPSFTWTLDCAASFRGHTPPCVLRSAIVPPLLLALWKALDQALMKIGMHRRVERPITPHVTLAYGRRQLPGIIRIEPISWQVTHFTLVHSAVGKGGYRLLGQWPLSA